MTDVRYPIGRYEPQPFSTETKEKWIEEIKCLPEKAEAAISDLLANQLNTPYREGGWTVRQVVHHIADSHMNFYIRLKLGLTENAPTIKPYDENAWSKLIDVELVSVNVSLSLIRALHNRLYVLLKNMKDEEYERTVFNPEKNHEMSLWTMLGLYAWHGKHHVAHITSLREVMNW